MERGFVTIGGNQYIVELREYRKRDITDFSPRVTVPEGPLYSELGLYQPMPMTDWRGGFGVPWQGVIGNGYLTTYGEVDCRHDGMILRMTKAIRIADTIQAPYLGFQSFGGDWYAYGDCGTGKLTASGDSFTDMATPDSDSAGINDLWTNGKYLFAAVDDQNIQYCSSQAASCDWAVGSWADGTADSTVPSDFKWLHHHAGFLYAGKDLSDSGDAGNQIYYGQDIDLGDLFSDTTSDSDHMVAGIDGWGTIGALSMQEQLIIMRPDGIYKMEADKSACKPALHYKDLADTDNFKGRVIHNENMVYTIKDQIFQWNGFAVSNVTPRALGDTWPYKGYRNFSHFTSVGSFLYVLANTNTSPEDLDLLCWDGVSWARLNTLYLGDSGSTNLGGALPSDTAGIDGAAAKAMAYDPVNSRLWYSYQSSGYVTGYVPFSTGGNYPSPDFSTDGDHYLETSKLHAGFRFIKKSTPSLLVEADNLSTDVFVEVYYKTDTDTIWRPWGGDSGETNLITKPGLTELFEPRGHAHQTLEYYYMQYRVYLRTNTSDQTPRITAVIPRVLMRPKTLWGWDMTIVAQKEGQHGDQIDLRTADEIENDLMIERNSVQPVEYVDIYGGKYWVNLTAVNSAAVEWHGEEGAKPDIEQMINISMVQLG